MSHRYRGRPRMPRLCWPRTACILRGQCIPCGWTNSYRFRSTRSARLNIGSAHPSRAVAREPFGETMKTQRIWWIAGASLAMFAMTARAQQAQQITFGQAIDIALKQNLTVKQAENNVILQQATADQATKSLLPTLQFSTTGANSVGQQFNLQTGKLSTQTTRSLNPNIGGTVTLYNGNQNYATIASARDLTQADVADLLRTRQ